MDQLVRCTQCGHEAPESDFPHGRDFFQNSFIAACPQCDNRQSPGNASMRMMQGNAHPFVRVDAQPRPTDAIGSVIHDANEVS